MFIKEIWLPPFLSGQDLTCEGGDRCETNECSEKSVIDEVVGLVACDGLCVTQGPWKNIVVSSGTRAGDIFGTTFPEKNALQDGWSSSSGGKINTHLNSIKLLIHKSCWVEAGPKV